MNDIATLERPGATDSDVTLAPDIGATDSLPAAPKYPDKIETGSAVVKRADLLAAMQSVARVVEKNSRIPILAFAIIRAGNGGMVIESTNLDMICRVDIPANIDDDFVALVPAHKLVEILKKAKATESVSISYKLPVTWRDGHYVGHGDSTVTLNFDGLKVSLHGLDHGDFPEWQADAPTHTFEIDSAVLAKAIERFKFAISTEEARYYLNGAYMHREGDSLRFVTTDGHRMAIIDLPAPAESDGMEGVIIPTQAITELQRLVSAKGAPKNVEVSLCGVKTAFTVGATVIFTKNIDGSFPDYRRVVPQDNTLHVIAEPARLSTLIEQVSCISSDRGKAVKLEIAAGTLTAVVSNPDMGSATDSMPVKYDGPAFDCGYNAMYLRAVLDALDSDAADIALADIVENRDEKGNLNEGMRYLSAPWSNPCIIRAADWQDAASKDFGVTYILMPMRV